MRLLHRSVLYFRQCDSRPNVARRPAGRPRDGYPRGLPEGSGSQVGTKMAGTSKVRAFKVSSELYISDLVSDSHNQGHASSHC